MTLTRKAVSALIGSLCISTLLHAADDAKPAEAAKPADAAAPAEPAKPAGPTLSDVLGASGIDLKGYLDAAYSYQTSSGNFTSGTAARVFDTEHSSFNLHQVGLTIAKQPKEGFGGLVNITAGRDARVIRSFDQQSDNFDVTQAFMQYAGGPWTFIGGKFVTLAGAEVIDPTANTNYSRSILFGYAIPFTHTGVRATYAANDQTNLIVGVNNGWDQLKDANTQKTIELGATYAPSKMLSFAATGYFGKEQMVTSSVPTIPGGMRSVIDLVATVNVTDADTIIGNIDFGSQKCDSTQASCNAYLPSKNSTGKWDGIALYWNHQISDPLKLSLRGELFDDKDGYRTGVEQKWKELTATLAFTPAKNVELRGELRYDFSDQSSFVKPDGSTSKNNTSLGVEAIYKF